MNWFRPGEAQKDTANDPRAVRGDGDALAVSVVNFLVKTGLFDREYYLAAYPDVAKSGIDPLHHFMRVGIQAGRSFTSVDNIARLWRQVLNDPSPPPASRAPKDTTRVHAVIYVMRAGNFFMREIAEIILAGFADAGITASLCYEDGTPPANATHHIVIAPQEFFLLGKGKRFATDDFMSRAVMYSTEQLQTPWFARSLVFMLRGRAVAEINGQNADIFRRGGVRAFTVQPGYSPGYRPFALQQDVSAMRAFDSLPQDVRTYDVASPDLATRPIDLLFLGTSSPRREKLLAGYAPKFAELRSFIFCLKTIKPIEPSSNPMAAPEVTAAMLQRTRILLNLHRDEYTFFEWWRLMQAFWQKTLVVTEPCFPHPVFKAGVHYLEESPRHIPHLIDWLLRTPDGQAKAEEIRARAFQDLCQHATARQAALALLEAGEAS
jgi:hypothetical protein